MTIQNPPGWIQALSTHTAAQLRMYTASLQAGMFSSATSLRARGGVHPGFGGEFVVTQAGSPNMTVLVESGACSIPGSESSTQGNYFAVNDAQVTLSITAAHATLNRIDIVVVNIRDAQYSGANNDAQLQVITGTPASSPVAPTAPANSITIAQVSVVAADTAITNGEITDTRFYMSGVGGVINARNDAARPASTEIGVNQLVATLDNKKLYLWDGSAYFDIARVNDVNSVIDAIQTNVSATDVTSGTTELNLSRLVSASLSVSTDRLYQTDIQIVTTKSVAADEFEFRLRQTTALSGTVVGSAFSWGSVNTSGQYAKASILWTPASTTTTTFHLSVVRNSGSGTITAFYANFGQISRTQVIHRRLGINTLLRTITV